jgi:hypothetical protein
MLLSILFFILLIVEVNLEDEGYVTSRIEFNLIIKYLLLQRKIEYPQF